MTKPLSRTVPVCLRKIIATLHSEKSILRMKISSKQKKKKKNEVSRKWFVKVLQPCKWIVDTVEKKERVHGVRWHYSREFYPQVSRFLHSKVKLSRITLQSSILTLIRKSKISIPVLQSFILKNEYPPRPKNYPTSSIFFFSFSDRRSSRALSYLILIRVRSSREMHAGVHFFPKFFPSLTERRGSCLKLNSGIRLVKYLALTQLGTKLQFPLVSSRWKLLRGIVSLKLKKPKQPRSIPLFSLFLLLSLSSSV